MFECCVLYVVVRVTLAMRVMVLPAQIPMSVLELMTVRPGQREDPVPTLWGVIPVNAMMVIPLHHPISVTTSTSARAKVRMSFTLYN